MHFGMVIFVRDCPKKIGALFGLVSYNDTVFCFPWKLSGHNKMLSQQKIIVKKSCPTVFWQHLRTNGLETIQIIEFAQKVFAW